MGTKQGRRAELRRLNQAPWGPPFARLVGPLVVGGLVCVCAAIWPLAASARASSPAAASSPSQPLYVPPLPLPLDVLSPFRPPPQPWAAGNRGVDLATAAGAPVVAAAAGTVIYAGELAGRGVVSIDHGVIRTTYEPVDAIVGRGDHVTRGQLIGHVQAVADGCGPPGRCLHWGAIGPAGYADPLSLLSSPQGRIRLLPLQLPVQAPLQPPAEGPARQRAAPATAQAAGPSGAAAARRTGSDVSGVDANTIRTTARTLGVVAVVTGWLAFGRRRRR
jgi:hypothetical protein